MATGTEVYHFGEFALDVAQRQVSGSAGAITLAPKAFDLLAALVRRADRLVTKEELLTVVWPEASVEEGILAVHVSALRKALGDTHRAPRFIQTVAGSGYRFVARLDPPDPGQPPVRVGEPLLIHHPSIAVLPFANLSDNPQHVYFSDGLTDEIITAVGQIPGLRVTARTSSFAFRGKEQDLRRIAEALAVTTILEGSVRRVGSRIRVTAQLVDAADGLHLWSQRYDRELTDVFAVQDDIAAAIAGTLRVAMTGGHGTPRPPLAAYEAYLKALHFQHLYGGEATMKECQRWHEAAIAIAPDYVAAHVGLAASLVSMATEGVRHAREVMPLARLHAERALALDPHHADAHAILGVIAANFDYDNDAVERAWREVGLRPNSYVGVWFGITYLSSRCGPAAAIDLLGRALEVDPLNGLFRSIQAFLLVEAGMPDRAIDVAGRCVELGENAAGGHFNIARAYIEKGMVTEAVAAAEEAYRGLPGHPRFIGLLAGTRARSGDRDGAERLLAPLRDGSQSPGAAMGMIQYHLVSGELEGAIPWFHKAIENREPLVKTYAASRRCEPLRANVSFQRLLNVLKMVDRV